MVRAGREVEEALQRASIGNPRHHVTVRDDWREPPEPIVAYVFLGLALMFAFGVWLW
jgi:hypothetical protein